MEERFRERTWMKCGGRTCRNTWGRRGAKKERRRYSDEDMQQTWGEFHSGVLVCKHRLANLSW